jgi:hypothetical protein
MLARVIVPAPPWMTSMTFPGRSAAAAESANTIVADESRRRMNMVRTVSLLISVVVAAAVGAQGPDAGWRTVRTEHFRVHYPAPYEEWSLRAASRLESIRAEVAREIGFSPNQVIDVLVTNPIAEPNGSAWPLLDTPRIVFFAEPPGPDEQLGAYGHWIDLLAVHEVAHVVHMLRPSRNPFERMLEKSVFPFNPILVRSPRWVLEGYATVVEGRLTGAGRPSSTIRALILRRWAESGRLPTYAQLDSDQRFLGMSMAYLMGSAYLEWLEQRGGPDSLRKLWTRMTARHRRSFEEAFAGVYGERPDKLYGRFLAELTASSIAIDRASALREGELFQETTRGSGDPAVSPDGKQIAVVLRERDKPQKLVIWSTAPADEEEKKFEERLKKILGRDPEDVPPVRTKPLPREPVHSLVMPDGGDIDTPRWTRDGKGLVFAHRVPDADGMLHFDLFRWNFEELTRVTHGADVRDVDPVSDSKAIGVRSRNGASQLVAIDLMTGSVSPQTEASIDVVYSHPRVSPDGARIAYVAHRDGGWRLFVEDLSGVRRAEDPAAEAAAAPWSLAGDVSSPEWLASGGIIATVSKGGFAELHREGAPVTRSRGGAFSPAPAPDGRVFFMSLEPDGYVVRVLESIEDAPAPPPADPMLIPAIPPAPPQVTPFAASEVSPPRGYGIGRQELGWLTGTTYAPGHRSYEAGLRLGDVVGRLDTLLIGAMGSGDAPEGVALATAWRGWPVEVHAHGFRTDETDGLELRGIWSRRFPRSALRVEAGVLSDDLKFGTLAFSTRQILGTWRVEEGVRAEVDDKHYRGVVTASARAGSMRVGIRYQHDSGDTVALGGIASSILPRSAYALRVLDPALPLATATGDEYDGWRIESTVPSLPLTAFYQRHELDGGRLSIAGVEVRVASDPFPILKVPGLDLTAGVAKILDGGETNWWLGMRWRP